LTQSAGSLVFFEFDLEPTNSRRSLLSRRGRCNEVNPM